MIIITRKRTGDGCHQLEEKPGLKREKNNSEKKIFGRVVGGLEKRKEIGSKGITSALPVVQQAVHKKTSVCVLVGLFVRAFMKECVSL